MREHLGAKTALSLVCASAVGGRRRRLTPAGRELVTGVVDRQIDASVMTPSSDRHPCPARVRSLAESGSNQLFRQEADPASRQVSDVKRRKPPATPAATPEALVAPADSYALRILSMDFPLASSSTSLSR